MKPAIYPIMLMYSFILKILFESVIGGPIKSSDPTIFEDSLYNIYRLHIFIKHRSDNVFYTDDLNNYGCWCGQPGQGQPGQGQPVDNLDRCCFKHRICIKEALNSSCPLSSKFYEVNVCPNESVTCVDTDPCKHKFCSCDAKAVECLTDHETSYNRHYKDGDKKVYCRH